MQETDEEGGDRHQINESVEGEDVLKTRGSGVDTQNVLDSEENGDGGLDPDEYGIKTFEDWSEFEREKGDREEDEGDEKDREDAAYFPFSGMKDVPQLCSQKCLTFMGKLHVCIVASHLFEVLLRKRIGHSCDVIFDSFMGGALETACEHLYF